MGSRPEKRKIRKIAKCHPERPGWALELCRACYQQQYREKSKITRAFIHSRQRFKKKIILALLDRYGLYCWYCGDFTELTGAEIDHIVPKSKGGSSDLSNLAYTCKICNRAKGSYNLNTYIIWLKRRGVVNFGPYIKDKTAELVSQPSEKLEELRLEIA